MKKIKEEDKIHLEWYEETRKINTIEEFNSFFHKLTKEYEHDYGTICHAIAAIGIAAMRLMDKDEQAGITGFQASCITQFIMEHWGSIKPPYKLLQYERMLYPQYEYEYEKTMSNSTFNWLKEQAQEKLVNDKNMHPNVKAHMLSILVGCVPFGYKIEYK